MDNKEIFITELKKLLNGGTAHAGLQDAIDNLPVNLILMLNHLPDRKVKSDILNIPPYSVILARIHLENIDGFSYNIKNTTQNH